MDQVTNRGTNFWQLFWQPFWQLFDNLLTTFWQLLKKQIRFWSSVQIVQLLKKMLFFLAFHFSLSLTPNCRNWSPNYSVIVLYAFKTAEDHGTMKRYWHLCFTYCEQERTMGPWTGICSFAPLLCVSQTGEDHKLHHYSVYK
jgi:hypothetical protein